jgi:hypothetical protein
MSNKLPIIQYRSVKPQILIEVLVDPIQVNLVVHQGNFAWWQAEGEESRGGRGGRGREKVCSLCSLFVGFEGVRI